MSTIKEVVLMDVVHLTNNFLQFNGNLSQEYDGNVIKLKENRIFNDVKPKKKALLPWPTL